MKLYKKDAEGAALAQEVDHRVGAWFFFYVIIFCDLQQFADHKKSAI